MRLLNIVFIFNGILVVDASLGEVITTCAKLRWTIDNGENVLSPEYRDPGLMMMYKHAKIVYQPMGVVAALVSWNYPYVLYLFFF